MVPQRPQGGEIMIKYEVMFIINPTVDEAGRTEVIDKVKACIEEMGTVKAVDEMGLRKLAYPIEKKLDGYYVVVDFEASPELPKELDRRLKINDRVMRHLIVNKEQK